MNERKGDCLINTCLIISFILRNVHRIVTHVKKISLPLSDFSISLAEFSWLKPILLRKEIFRPPHWMSNCPPLRGSQLYFLKYTRNYESRNGPIVPALVVIPFFFLLSFLFVTSTVAVILRCTLSNKEREINSLNSVPEYFRKVSAENVGRRSLRQNRPI